MNDGRDFVALYKQTKLYKMCICSYFVILFLTNIHAYQYVLTFIYFHCWWTTRQHHLGFWPSSLVILKLLQRVQGLFKNLQFHGCVTLAPEVTCWAIICFPTLWTSPNPTHRQLVVCMFQRINQLVTFGAIFTRVNLIPSSLEFFWFPTVLLRLIKYTTPCTHQWRLKPRPP